MNKQTKNDISTKTNDNKVSNNFSMIKLWNFLHLFTFQTPIFI